MPWFVTNGAWSYSMNWPDRAPSLRGLSGAVELREQRAGEIEVAVVDVRRRLGGAGVAVVIGDHRMLGRDVFLVHDVGRRHELRVVRGEVVHHRRPDRAVERAREQVDLRGLQVGDRVDRADRGPVACLLREARDRDAARMRHAAPGRVDDRPFGAVVGTAGDDTDALGERRRIGDVQLHRHVAAGRQTRDRGLRPVDHELRQRLGRASSRACKQRERGEYRLDRAVHRAEPIRPSDWSPLAEGARGSGALGERSSAGTSAFSAGFG